MRTKPAPKGVRDPLAIRDLEFLGGMAAVGGWRPSSELPEVAFAGRSNVGKSSLLNRLVRRKAFARVSNTPGRTREINFFKVNGAFVFVDLPGYGYARVSKTAARGVAATDRGVPAAEPIAAGHRPAARRQARSLR